MHSKRLSAESPELLPSLKQTGNSPLLSVNDLKVVYVTDHGNVRAVDGITFDIQRGEVFGLAGESGCGKSTAAHAILRILHPPAVITGGEVSFLGKNILTMNMAELEAFRWKEISIVFQSAMNALNPVMTIGEQITDAIIYHQKVSKTQAYERAKELMDMVGIETNRLKSYPHQLSGGMRQRVIIATALALQPAMMIMDEPTTALDVVVQKDILQQIEDLKNELGFSILFITHDLSLLVETADRIGIMYAGELVELAPARGLFNQPLHPYTKGLMNSFPSLTGPKEKLVGIPGSPPNLINPPKACRFHVRCPFAQPVCSQEKPLMREVLPGHQVACHFAESLSSVK